MTDYSKEPLGAVVMRERAIDVLDDTVTGPSINSWVAIDRASNAIYALPLPTHAEMLAHALTLPEIKALEMELKLRREIDALERLCDHDCDNEDCVRCFHYPDILEQRRTTLAQMKGKTR